MNYWLRLYTSILNDPKVQRLKAEHFKGWINLLCLAKETDGVLPEIADIAFRLRIEDAEAKELVEALKRAGLLDEESGVLMPHNWRGRQFQSDIDPTAAERARKYRANKRDATVMARHNAQPPRRDARDAAASRHATITRDATVTQKRDDVTVTPAEQKQSRDGAETEQQRKQKLRNFAAAAANNKNGFYSDEQHASQFAFELIKEYCALKRHATNPGGLARTLYRSGEEDADIARWIEEQNRLEQLSAAPLIGPNDDFSDFSMAEYIAQLINLGDTAALENEREGIRDRGGPSEEWERRVIEYLNQHGGDHDQSRPGTITDFSSKQ